MGRDNPPLDHEWLEMLLDNFEEEELTDIFLIPDDMLRDRKEMQ